MEDNDRIKILDKYPGPLSAVTNVGRADQLKELEDKIKLGYGGVEIGTMSPHLWAHIPKQIFEDIARLAYVNDIRLSVHAPTQELQLSGFTGNMYSEEYRKRVANSMLYGVLQSVGEMARIYGKSIKVNVHTSDAPVFIWDKKWEDTVKNYLRTNRQAFEDLKNKLVRMGFLSQEQARNINDPSQLPSWVFAKAVIATRMNPEGYFGDAIQIAAEKVYDPTRGEVIKTVADVLYEQNDLLWRHILSESWRSIFYIKNNLAAIAEEAAKALHDPSKVGNFYNAYSLIEVQLKQAKEILEQAYTYLKNFGSREALENIRNRIQQVEEYKRRLENIKRELDRLKMIALERPAQEYQNFAKYVFDQIFNYTYNSVKIFEELANELGKISMRYGPPKILYPTPELTIEKAGKTIAESFKRYLEYVKNKYPDYWKDPEKLNILIPQIVIENPHFGCPGTRPDEWEKFIKKAREEVKKVIENEFPDLARKIREKYGDINRFIEEKIAGTLDVGHLRQFTQAGYTKEEILEWIRKMKPYVKHIHIHESQWGMDTHLPPGMGWEDILKAEMEELKDKLSEKGVYLVNEMGGWYLHFFQTRGYDLPYTLQYGGFSPYLNLSYEEALFKPEYFMSAMLYQPIYTPGIYVTQYSPFVKETFSDLPPHLGGRRVQTFSGVRTE